MIYVTSCLGISDELLYIKWCKSGIPNWQVVTWVGLATWHYQTKIIVNWTESDFQMQHCSVVCKITCSIVFNVICNKQATGKDQVVLDPQTEADRRTQQCIISSLRKQYPNVHIIGEEVVHFDIYSVGQKKTGRFLEVCNSRVFWRRIASILSNCSAFYPEEDWYIVCRCI